MIRHAAPHRREHRWGRIPNMGSEACPARWGGVGICNDPEIKASVYKAGKAVFTVDGLCRLVPMALLRGYTDPAPAEAG